MNPIFAQQPTSIFEHMSGLARAFDAVNLGQGFPDFGWPDDVVAKAAEALTGASNQYPPMRGLPVLREAVAAYYGRRQGLSIDVEQVTITSGATEAIAASLMALIEPGDEVLMFQPLYDAYLPLVLRAGGVPRFAKLAPPEWRMTEEMLAAAFSDRTRLVIFNNPHNPTARVFDRAELVLLADHITRHDVVLLSDEVWEEVVFDGLAHLPIASLPGMAERTVKVGSAGKIFSLTGWKVGWVVAPRALSATIAKAHQFLTFTTPPNLQAAVAYGLGKEETYFAEMRAAFAVARDRMAAGLADAGFAVLPAQGTYFMTIDLAASGINLTDREFCEQAVQEAGVAAIPISALYVETAATTTIRLCFAKTDAVIDAGVERLAQAHRLRA